MPTTTNFGWTTPADTDLVKDGAAAIRTLGSAIDTSLLDLKGGTSGQYLTKNSNTDLDYAWVTLSAGGMTSLASGTLSGTAVNLTSISGSYNNLVLVLRDFYPTSGGSGVRLRLNNNSTANNYIYTKIRSNNTTLVNISEPEFFFDDAAVGPSLSDKDQHAVFILRDYANTTTKKLYDYNFVYQTTSSVDVNVAGFGAFKSAGAITEINLAAVTGNLAGTYVLYGVK
jgi:hypothetical protein